MHEIEIWKDQIRPQHVPSSTLAGFGYSRFQGEKSNLPYYSMLWFILLMMYCGCSSWFICVWIKKCRLFSGKLVLGEKPIGARAATLWEPIRAKHSTCVDQSERSNIVWLPVRGRQPHNNQAFCINIKNINERIDFLTTHITVLTYKCISERRQKPQRCLTAVAVKARHMKSRRF